MPHAEGRMQGGGAPCMMGKGEGCRMGGGDLDALEKRMGMMQPMLETLLKQQPGAKR